jgi:arylsulfatase
VTGIIPGNEPNILNKSYTITADVNIPQGGGEGMLVTEGGRFGGYGLYLLKGKPVLLYNLLGLARHRWEGPQALSPGKHTIAFKFDYQGPGPGKGGVGVLSVDEAEVARRTIPNSVPIAFGVDESFDVGSDTGTPVDDKDYQVPFAFTGQLNKLTVQLKPPQLAAREQTSIEEKLGRRD